MPFPKALVLVMHIHCRKPPNVLTRHPGLTPGQGGRRDGRAGGEILPAHVYRKEKE
jgi:hypothetical protein